MKPDLVIRWSNGMVMSFDSGGQQIPEFQGPFFEICDKLKTVDLDGVRFQMGNWSAETLRDIARSEFFGESQ